MMGTPAVETIAAQTPPSTSSLSPVETESVAVDTSENLILEDFDEWTVGGGYLYWATNCRSASPENRAPKAQVPSNHYALQRWPIGDGTPEIIITASHTNCNTFRFLTADADGVNHQYPRLFSRRGFSNLYQRS